MFKNVAAVEQYGSIAEGLASMRRTTASVHRVNPATTGRLEGRSTTGDQLSFRW
jgi:hypothetical protein